MMDGTFVEALAGRIKDPTIHDVDGRAHLALPPGWTAVKRDPPGGHTLKVGTLTGLVDYLAHEPLAAGIVHVENPTTVSVKGPAEGESTDFRRRTHLVATTELVQIGFPFGRFTDAEMFFIGLQTAFVADEHSANLLTFVASIRENKVAETTDSGYAQRVSVQQGISFIGDRTVPNPWTLRPWRTFVEIEQPASAFVVRLQRAKEGERPQTALFEADGARWKLEAILAIAAYLRAKVPGVKVIA
jgi:hypothetical protein